MREIQLNMYHALALGAVMYWLGAALTRKLPALRRFCVPAPLVGGLCFALFNTLLYASGLAVITFDETLETVFMILFFTTVGFTVSFQQITITSAAFVDIQAPAMSQQDASAPVAASAAKSAKSTTQNGLVTTGSDYAAYVASFNSKNTNPSVATGRTNPSYAGYNREAIK